MKLTPAEIGLLRTVITDLKQSGWTYSPFWAEWRSADQLRAFRITLTQVPIIEAASRTSPDRSFGWRNPCPDNELCPSSVEHAVDALVWLGILPVELSSAYRAGVEHGVDSVTDITIENLMDAELDKLAEGGDEIGALLDKGPVPVLADDPWVRRHQLAAIVEAAQTVLGRRP